MGSAVDLVMSIAELIVINVALIAAAIAACYSSGEAPVGAYS